MLVQLVIIVVITSRSLMLQHTNSINLYTKFIKRLVNIAKQFFLVIFIIIIIVNSSYTEVHVISYKENIITIRSTI